MRLTATEFGFYEDEETLEVGIAGIDSAGVRRSFSMQRSTYEPDEQEIQAGMDSYNISTERGFTSYGCLRRVRITDSVLVLQFTAEGAEILEIANPVEAELYASGADGLDFPKMLREVLDWGARERRPELIGLGTSDLPIGD